MLDWTKRAKSLGADAAKLIPADGVMVADWVRLKCQFGCDGYGERLTCPPYSPAPETTRRLLGSYKKALLLRWNAKGKREEDHRWLRLHETVTALEREIFLAGHERAYGLTAGPCPLCETCDVTGLCKFPDQARPSMEASGIDVFSTVRAAGWDIEVVKTLQSPYSLFGLVLIE